MVFRVSVGIAAYNEERGISHSLKSVLNQKMPPGYELIEIIIVSSGSTDGTNSIVKSFQKSDSRIILIEEPVKRGKSAAVNVIFRTFKGDVLVLSGADSIYKKSAIYWLLKGFNSNHVGAVCGHIMPINPRQTLWDYGSHLLYDLHHLVTLIYPQKLSGELFAIRRQFIRPVPENAGGDDVYLERVVVILKGTITYAPNAVIYILGPRTAMDYFKQRRRVMCHIKYAEKQTRIKATTMDIPNTMKIFIKNFSSLFSFHTLPVISMEILARVFAAWDLMRNKVPANWESIISTKSI